MNEWQPMNTHPRGQNVEVLMQDDKVFVAHWAEGGGEDQPPFRGWFVEVPKTEYGDAYYFGIETPKAWRQIG